MRRVAIGPADRVRGFVVAVDVSTNLAGQVGDGGNDAARQEVPLDLRKPQFDLVEPGITRARRASSGRILRLRTRRSSSARSSVVNVSARWRQNITSYCFSQYKPLAHALEPAEIERLMIDGSSVPTTRSRASWQIQALKHFGKDGGSIINIGSMSSERFSASAVAYTASKAALPELLACWPWSLPHAASGSIKSTPVRGSWRLRDPLGARTALSSPRPAMRARCTCVLLAGARAQPHEGDRPRFLAQPPLLPAAPDNRPSGDHNSRRAGNHGEAFCSARMAGNNLTEGERLVGRTVAVREHPDAWHHVRHHRSVGALIRSDRRLARTSRPSARLANRTIPSLCRHATMANNVRRP
jgi:hypothetical protein